MGNVPVNEMENITLSGIIEKISSLTLGEEEVKFLEVKDDLYSYKGTISKLDMSTTFKPTRISFRSLPNRRFWWPGDKLFPSDIQIGTRVKITYEEHLVKTYSHFWIKNIKIANVKDETVHKRKQQSDLQSGEESPSIRCSNNDCGKHLFLKNSIQCNGIIEKGFWQKYPHCNKCNSVSEDVNIGNRCIRETIVYDDCEFVRKI